MNILSQQALAKWQPPLGAVIITDLDGCAVDSSHRQHCNEDGTLNLDDWREHCTPELISRDKLTLWGLRLAELARTRQDLTIGVCSSRVMQDADYIYINEAFQIGRFSGLIWSRPETCRLSDEDLKYKLFTDPKNIYNTDLLMSLNLGKMYFLDDLNANCRVAENLGLNAILTKKGLTA